LSATPILLAVLLASALATGCGAPRDRAARLARVSAEGRNLDESLDRLEERLLATQARVRYWREMRERHESVSAVACASQDEHAAEMAIHALPGDRSSLHRAKVAAALSDVPKARVRSDAGRP
jgi:outer membrane murein-binding lipoprotein Lpp